MKDATSEESGSKSKHLAQNQSTWLKTIGDEGWDPKKSIMATAVFGLMERFNSDNEGIQAYLERVELYFVANEVGEEFQSS